MASCQLVRAAVALTLLQLCSCSHQLADHSGRSVVALGEQGDFETETGLNKASLEASIAGKDGETVEAIKKKVLAAESAKSTAGKKTTSALDIKLLRMTPAETPIDVMLDPASSSTLSAVKQNGGLPAVQLHKINKLNDELQKDQDEQEAGATPTDPIQKMQVDIRRAVRQSILNVAKDLPPGATTWNSVIPSEHAVRAAAAAGLTPPAQQLEMAAAEREALQRREHAVQKAEQNIAFMEHSAAFKVRQATRQAGSTETQELKKAEEMEQNAEAKTAKARSDEQSALKVESQDKKEVANLKAENKGLQDKLKQMKMKEGKVVAKAKSDTVKMNEATKHAVKSQAMKDKLKSQSTLSTMADKAKGLSDKTSADKAILQIKQHQIDRLRKHMDTAKDFSKVEVSQAIAQAHLVAHKLYQAKIKDMEKNIIKLRIVQKSRLHRAAVATKEWAGMAARLKAKLDEQQTAADLNSETSKQIKKAEVKLQNAHKNLKISQHKNEIHKAKAEIDQVKLVKEQVKNKESEITITKLRTQETEMHKKQKQLKLSSQAASDKLKDVQEELKRTKSKLAEHLPKAEVDYPRLATTKDFLQTMANQAVIDAGGHDLPHKSHIG